VNLAGTELEAGAVEREDAREALADVGHLDQKITHGGYPFEDLRLPG